MLPAVALSCLPTGVFAGMVAVPADVVEEVIFSPVAVVVSAVVPVIVMEPPGVSTVLGADVFWFIASAAAASNGVLSSFSFLQDVAKKRTATKIDRAERNGLKVFIKFSKNLS